MAEKEPCKGLLDRIRDGETVICAEGYLFVFERRGYLTAGMYVPEVVLDHPELLRQQYEEFVHAGSDIVLAFTYYAHREKMALLGRADELERMNKDALRIARDVADQTGTLMAGNLTLSQLYEIGTDNYKDIIKQMFKEQIEWDVEAGADFIVAETFHAFGEALIAVEACKEFGKGIPCVVTLSIKEDEVNGKAATEDGVEVCDALNRLAEAGAGVVGLNCARGPATMLPILGDVVKNCKGPIAAVPVVYRTNEKNPIYHTLVDPMSDKPVFPTDLDCVQCSRTDVHEFGQRVQELGIKYVGLCCGNAAHYTRALAESLGRKPPASRYTPNLSNNWLIGKGTKPDQAVLESMYGTK